MRKPIFLLTLLILTAGGQFIFAQTGKTGCSMQAYVIDTNSEGVTVYSQPAAESKVLAKLVVEYGDTALPAITVRMIGYSNGWVKIGSAKELTGEIAISKKISSKGIFSGTGWVSAKLLAVRTQGSPKANKSVQLYAEAKTSSRKSGTIPDDYPVKITGFTCGWLKIDYEGRAGWAKKLNICGNPVAAC